MITVVYTFACDVPNCGVIVSVPRASQVGQVEPPATAPAGWTSQFNFLVCPKHKVAMTIDGAPVTVFG